MLLRPLAYRRRFDDFHSLGQFVLNAAVRQAGAPQPLSEDLVTRERGGDLAAGGVASNRLLRAAGGSLTA